MNITQPPGATPLDPDELAGLLPMSISTQGELNSFEQANIAEAETWALSRRRKDCLSESFVRELHRRMLAQVWRWAGTYRTSDKNLGDPWAQIPARIHQLCGDAQYWIDNSTYAWDELGARFHHRIVAIHPFANGNGRHGRLITDVLMQSHDQKLFSWGSDALGAKGEARERYLVAMRAADARDYAPLIRFVRS